MNAKLFNKWDCESVVVQDMGIKGIMRLDNRAYPCTFGLQAGRKYGKANTHIIERVANDLMVTGHIKDTRVHKRISSRDTGKKQRVMGDIEDGLAIIEKKTNKNPVQVLVQAVENAAPREETTRIRQGGIIVHKSVDVSPARRLDLALKFLTHGAGQRCFNKRMSLGAALAEEVIAASNYDNKTYSVGKKEELERVAQSAR